MEVEPPPLLLQAFTDFCCDAVNFLALSTFCVALLPIDFVRQFRVKVSRLIALAVIGVTVPMKQRPIKGIRRRLNMYKTVVLCVKLGKGFGPSS